MTTKETSTNQQQIVHTPPTRWLCTSQKHREFFTGKTIHRFSVHDENGREVGYSKSQAGAIKKALAKAAIRKQSVQIVQG